MDASGNLPGNAALWFQAGQTYKAVYAPANDIDPPASPYRTIDNLSGVNDVTAAASEWIAGPAPTYVSGTQFTLVGDQTANFKVSGRIKATVTAGTVYGSISSVSFGAGITTVNVAFASGALDAGLSAISYSLTSVLNPSINADYIDKQAASVSSATGGTTNIWGIGGNSAHVTGTTTINGFSSSPYVGAIRDLIFDNSLQLTQNPTTLITPLAANINTVPGAVARVYADGASTRVLSFMESSSFMGTMTGVNPAVTSSFTYLVMNGLAILNVPLMLGVSNNTATQITGLPAAVTPASNHNAMSISVQDASSTKANLGRADVSSTSVMTLYPDFTASNWTNTGNKGFAAGGILIYSLN